jgi:hypothetical protein
MELDQWRVLFFIQSAIPKSISIVLSMVDGNGNLTTALLDAIEHFHRSDDSYKLNQSSKHQNLTETVIGKLQNIEKAYEIPTVTVPSHIRNMHWSYGYKLVKTI